jgi:hypothetical protein
MQTVFVIVVITAASIYLGRQFYQRFFSKDTKCDGCAVNKMMSVDKNS